MKELEFESTLRGHPLQFKSTWGLFSPKKIDEGTEQLLKQIELPSPSAEILDLGCGYGPIGLTLAKDVPKGHVTMVDKDFVAIEYAQKNAALNGLKNTTTKLSNAFQHLDPELNFDLIVSNIPAKVGKEMLHYILDESQNRLKESGRLYLVCIAGLKDFMKRELKERFKTVKKLKGSKGYSCFFAEQ